MLTSTIEHANNESARNAPSGAELRRAGYFDGERAPRQDHHWANQSTSVSAFTRWWRNYRTQR